MKIGSLMILRAPSGLQCSATVKHIATAPIRPRFAPCAWTASWSVSGSPMCERHTSQAIFAEIGKEEQQA